MVMLVAYVSAKPDAIASALVNVGYSWKNPGSVRSTSFEQMVIA